MRSLILALSLVVTASVAAASFPQNPWPVQSIQVTSEKEELLVGVLVQPDLGPGGIIATKYQLSTKNGLINLVLDQSQIEKAQALLNANVMILGLNATVALAGPPFVAPAFYAYQIEKNSELRY